MPRILLTGGGSGGHIYPLIAVAEELNKQASQSGMELDMRFLGANKFSQSITEGLGIKFKNILSPKWRRYSSVENLVDILKAPLGFLQAFLYIWWFMPDLIFSKGGYDSFIPALVGRFFSIPVAIHESDVIPGKANLMVGKWAKKIFTSFEGAASYFRQDRVELVGNPVRAGITDVYDKSAAATAFSLDPAKPIVLITGASQGAQTINKILLLSLAELVKRYQVIHQCGVQNYDEINAQILTIVKEGGETYGKAVAASYRLYPFLDLQQMALAYSAVDVIVSRAGAGSIFEIAAVGKPAVLIPLKGSASGHQLANAREFAKFGATVIEEDNLTPHILMNEISDVYEGRANIAQNIKKFAKPAAAQTIAQVLLNMAK